ncbi:uncharacterized protein LOC124429718 isoform X2 [Vespa crabro]|uniref:uncharacterized protein LOC124429718 isoform X2 n=1 Tax=Vespa crabro TaxID=7445 RepID=UPI001F02BEDE|nr:uncharacterized protein LOC124429718 isoform X2 [Vespa crabro]
MNDPLENHIRKFGLSKKDTIYHDNDVDFLQTFGEQIDKQSPPYDLSRQLFQCEICKVQYTTKKQLRTHIFTHLGRPRVILKRVTNLETLNRNYNDTYWLTSENSQSLKLKLKKTTYTDPLKLTLKKSSVSENFIVVNTNHNLNIGNYSTEDVAGAEDKNEQTDTEDTENSTEETFENVMVDQDDDYEKFETDNDNALEGNERRSLDINEVDSGVGSDMANISEKEDQNIDDLHGTDHYDNSGKRYLESDDHEESDALEATCRETIENLKMLGEQSGSRTVNHLIISSVNEDDDTANEVDMIHDLEENPAISIISKSSTFSNHSVSEDDPKQSTETSTGFNWNQSSTDLTHKDKVNLKENEAQGENSNENNIESSTSLLQNFLIEHQRRNQSESISSNLPPVETEYVSLEKLAETVNTCRVCNEKFKDIAHLDEHRSKAGHYHCNIPDCANLIFHSPVEVSMHKSQVHGTSLSPNVSQLSPHLNTNSPHLNQNSPYLCRTSPQLNSHSPHAPSMESPSQLNTNSPLTSPHQTNSPTYTTANTGQQIIPPVNFEQLPAPVQQLAQQVQRMPLPQTQLPPSLPPGANTMIPGPNYFVQPPGRPSLYRVPGPQSMHYPSHLSHLYPQYGPGPYPQMTPAQMHPQLPQPMSRGRYPSAAQNTRAPRIPQGGVVPRQRLKRPMQQTMQVQQQQQQNNSPLKQRKMDVLMPDRNEDADCHVIAQQKRNDGLPVIQNVQGATTQSTNRNDSTIHLTDSITLSVRQPAQLQNTTNPGNKKSDAKAVANVLAARGITVTPAANKNKTGEQNKHQSSVQQQRPTSNQPSLNVPSLNLNSAISIVPANSQRKQQEQGQFAVPQNKQNKSPINDADRPPRPPTVDLTQDNPPQVPAIRRGRPPRATSLYCQMCDKNFQNQEMLSQHLANHRLLNKLNHKCNLCTAQYPSAHALISHKQTYHREPDPTSPNGNIELAIPVVDLKSSHVLNRLTNLGIQSYIPLSQLSAQTGGYFGLPLITIDGARNPNTCNLGALGATSVLSIGPLKHLTNTNTS